MCVGLHVKCRDSIQILVKLEILIRVSKNLQIIKFHENLPGGSRVVSWDGQTGKTKLTVAFRNFANASKQEPVGVNWLEVAPNTMQWRVTANILTKFRVA